MTLTQYEKRMNGIANDQTMVAYFQGVADFLAWYLQASVNDKVLAVYSLDALEAKQALNKYLRRARAGVAAWSDFALTSKADTFYTDMLTHHDKLGDYALDMWTAYSRGRN
jgi:hypothetical protein